MAGTLLCVQEERLCVERSLGDTVQASLDLLQEKDLIITVSQGDTRTTLEVTKLGRATYKSESSSTSTPFHSHQYIQITNTHVFSKNVFKCQYKL